MISVLRTNLNRLLEPAAISAKLSAWLLIGILAATAAIRLYTIGTPSLDRTRWKEIDYLSISQNYLMHGHHFLRPEISWPAEPPRVTAMELPLVPYAASLIYRIADVNTLTVRLLSLLGFLAMAFYVYRLTRRELGPIAGILAAFCAAAIPLYHEFGRILFSEPVMLACSVITIFHYAEWVDKKRRWDLLVAIGSFSLAVSLKPDCLYLLLPLWWATFRRHGFQPNAWVAPLIALSVALIVPVLWYLYAYHLTQTSIDVFGIFSGHNKLQTVTMLSNPAWWQEMAGRISWGILGFKPGVIIFGIGLIMALLVRRAGLFAGYLAAIGVFFAIVAEGQIDAPYRQLTIVPSLSAFLALGALALVATAMTATRRIARFDRVNVRAVSLASTLCGLALLATLPVYRHSDVLGRDPSRVEHGGAWDLAQQIRRIAPQGALIIAAGEYTIHKGGNDLSPVLYHYAGVQGWTLQRGQWRRGRVDSLVAKGASLFAARDMSRELESAPFIDEMRRDFATVYENKKHGLLLLDLTRPLGPATGVDE